MVGLKRLFSSGGSPDVTISRDTSSPFHPNDFASYSSSRPITPKSPPAYSSNALPDLNPHYVGIERQFEQLHESFYSRTLSSLRQFRYNGSAKSVSPSQNPKHVDVIEALFSGHRYRMKPISLSPSTPYNEDIADRNLNASPASISRNSHYSRIVSTLYQEDVADRNIVKSRAGPSYRYSSRSSSPTLRSDSPGDRSSKQTSRGRPVVQKRGSSQSKSRPSSETRENTNLKAPSPVHQSTLRAQASAPDFRNPLRTPDLASFPRPPTASAPEAATDNTSTNPAPPSLCNGPKARVGSSKNDHLRVKRPGLPRSGSCKNVLDLSIDTCITASKRPSIKIEHRAIQPPTPNNLTVPQNHSIAEIVNSPLPAVTPSACTPELSPSYNVDDIMGMFKQAYMTTQATTTGHPTFETLQDAIIREINSHDAFRCVPMPTTEPPFTPPASNNSFDEMVLLPPPGPSGRATKVPAEREGQLSKMIRKRSFVRTRGKSISSTKGGEKNVKKESHSFLSKRRHTYAQPPTAEWLRSIQQPAGTVTVPVAGNDTLLPPTIRIQAQAKQPRNRYHSKRNSDPIPPSPGFIPAKSQPEYPGYQMDSPVPRVVSNNNRLAVPGQKEQVTAKEIRTVDDNNVMYILNPEASVTPLELISATQHGYNRHNFTLVPFQTTVNGDNGVSERPRPVNTRQVPLRQSSLGSAA
ncbi:hypothetical protein BGW36DRAFT_428652 [Talaromyces proteolyticus]|uniref:Uncharacterized protein n=1 Tax=Talaromyces proteolyticus TaxID=1131652 RepID=A0AAD4KNE7_9EURO|nr:uncharacterized protein BGW36DRAFT_428652 [Talaromyces proteolyticus]KAH8696657.1 hypothetical protein BGW36DRAFT_428652 [Talaromyces proteolyticus]